MIGHKILNQAKHCPICGSELINFAIDNNKQTITLMCACGLNINRKYSYPEQAPDQKQSAIDRAAQNLLESWNNRKGEDVAVSKALFDAFQMLNKKGLTQ